MTTNINSATPADTPPDPRDLTVPGTIGGVPVEVSRRPGMPSERPGGGPSAGLSSYWHAFRRRWLAAILLGVAVAGALAPAVWFTYHPKYTATAMFYVAASQAPILPGTDRSVTAFDIYKKTQQQYVKSPFVVIAALRKLANEMDNLKAIRDEPDQERWLAQNIVVSFPDNGEIMQIGLKADDPDEAAKLVNAVVEAYEEEVVLKEDAPLRKQLDQLGKIRSDKEEELRQKRSQLKTLAATLGSDERETLTLQQQIELQQMGVLRNELSTMQFKLMRLNWDLESKSTALALQAKTPVTEPELEAYLRVDPVAAPLLVQRDEQRRRRDAAQSKFQPGGGTDYLKRYADTDKSIEDALNSRRKELREELKVQKEASLRAAVEQLKTEIAITKRQQADLTAELEKTSKAMKTVGTSSLDVKETQQEIVLLEGTLQRINDQREKLAIELYNKGANNEGRINEGRIRPLQDKVLPPAAPDSDRKVQYTVLAGLAGFFLPFGLIIWLDVRSRRVSSSGEVFETTGLDVIGAVPLVSERGRGMSLASTGRQRRLRDQLHESVDSVAARLLHLAERDQTRVVLVSSAVGGEGKTTLATQLAMSLARTGHRVLLVDFDLRQPAIDQVFDLPLEPGVAATLRKEADLREALQETEIENLWVLPAGRGDRRLLASLANGAVGALFGRLREEFDFVIVDGSPILPVADARFLCKHVDGVVLSVLRDVSSVPNILATCEVLAGFGVRPIGAVVTGAAGDFHYRAPGFVSGN